MKKELLIELGHAIKNRIRATRGNSSIKTKAIIDEIKEFSDQKNWTASFEVDIGYIENSKTGIFRKGRIDVLMVYNNERVVIEIDRANKRWSIDKLNYCHERFGWFPLWIRWKGFGVIQVPKHINVLDLTKHIVNIIDFNSVEKPPAEKRKRNRVQGAESYINHDQNYLDSKSRKRKRRRHKLRKLPVHKPTHAKKAYSIEEKRRQYPQAYKVWSEQEDQSAIDAYKEGQSISQIAQKHCRKPSAILSRLVKLRIAIEL
jgi:hypothetical protein